MTEFGRSPDRLARTGIEPLAHAIDRGRDARGHPVQPRLVQRGPGFAGAIGERRLAFEVDVGEARGPVAARAAEVAAGQDGDPGLGEQALTQRLAVVDATLA